MLYTSGGHSLVCSIELPESPPPQLDFNGIKSKSFSLCIAIQPHGEGKLYSLAQPRASYMSQSHTEQVESFAVTEQTLLKKGPGKVSLGTYGIWERNRGRANKIRVFTCVKLVGLCEVRWSVRHVR